MNFKKTILPFLIFSALLFFGFANKGNKYQTECVSIIKEGHITLNVWNTSKLSNYSVAKAQKDAIHSILFSGVQESKACQTQKPFLKDNQEKKKFKNIEKSFFSKKGDWYQFCNSSTHQNQMQKSQSSKQKVFTITIFKNKLRAYLEEKKIIHPLTKGF